MLESFVDLTYRGLSLGRRIKLTQVRPSTGYLEVPAPMPVGAQIAIATAEGAAFDATVIWVHEQVAGSDRPPGMVVAPALAGESAAAWWAERVSLAEDDASLPRAVLHARRSRPVTVRPRAHTDPMAVRDAATTDEIPTIIGDVDPAAGAAGAAGAGGSSVAQATSGDEAGAGATMVMPALADDAASPLIGEADPEATAVTAPPSPQPELPGERAAPGTGTLSDPGDPPVVDDAARTTIMDSIDPAMLGLEFGAIAGQASGGAGEAPVPARLDAGPPTGEESSGSTPPESEP